MTFFYSNNQLPRKVNSEMDLVILFYHLKLRHLKKKIRQKNKRLLLIYSRVWDFLCEILLQQALLTLWTAKVHSLKKKQKTLALHDRVPGSKPFSLGVDICVCLYFVKAWQVWFNDLKMKGIFDNPLQRKK